MATNASRRRRTWTATRAGLAGETTGIPPIVYQRSITTSITRPRPQRARVRVACVWARHGGATGSGPWSNAVCVPHHWSIILIEQIGRVRIAQLVEHDGAVASDLV